MAPSPCQSVQNHLSALLDGELEATERAQIEQHLAGCSECRAQFEDFREVGRLFQESAKMDAPNQWIAIESQLASSRPAASPWWRHRRTATLAALAASLLVAVGFWAHLSNRGNRGVEKLAANDPAGNSEPHHEHGSLSTAMGMADTEMEKMDAEHMLEFQRVMDDYLAKLSADPEQAEDFLLTKYDGKRVSPAQAETLVGFRPLISKGLPPGYELASSSIVKMPCCTCFKAVCRRGDGSTLVLFEHDDDAATWFGNRESKMETCGDKDCCLVDLNANIAATWKEGSRSITAVGVRDQSEVTTLVNALQES